MSDDLKRVGDLAAELPVGILLTGHAAKVFAVATTVVDGRPVAVTSSYDKTVRVWDLATGQPVGEPLTGFPGPVVVTMAEGRRVVVTSIGYPTVRVWDLATGQPVGEPLTGRTDKMMATTVVDGRPIVVTGGAPAQVQDLFTGEKLCGPLIGHPGQVNAVATAVVDGRPVAVTVSEALDCCGINDGGCCGGEVIDDDFCYICTACFDPNYGTVLVWDLATGERVGEAARHDDRVSAVATAVVDGHPVAVTGDDATVRVWDLASGELVGDPLTGDAHPVLAVATGVVDGRPVAVAGGENGAVRVWDLTTRQQLGAELVFPGAVRALAVAQDGRLVVAFGSNVAVLAATHCQEPQGS